MAKPRVSITCRRVNHDWRLAGLSFLPEQTARHSHQPLQNVRLPLVKIVKITAGIAFPSIKAYNIDECGATAEKTTARGAKEYMCRGDTAKAVQGKREYRHVPFGKASARHRIVERNGKK